MSHKILVTGATGTIGTQLVKQLQGSGADVSVLARPEAAPAGLPARSARYDDLAGLVRAFSGIDTLFVLLPLVPHKVQLARHVAEAAKAAGVKHIVRSSGAGADAKSAYSLARLQGSIDELFTATGIACTFLRPASFMQNYVNFYGGMVKDGVVYGATANAPQSLIDARDIAAVAAQVLQAPAAHAGKAYTLTGPQALTDEERVAILAKVLGRPVRYQAVPLEAGDASMREMGLPAELVDWFGSLNRIVTAGHAAAITNDVPTLLGREATPFARFAADYAAAWK